MRGETLSTSPRCTGCLPVASSAGEYSSQVSSPRITPTRPHTVWSWIGVLWPGIQTKLTTEKRSIGSQCRRYCR